MLLFESSYIFSGAPCRRARQSYDELLLSWDIYYLMGFSVEIFSGY